MARTILALLTALVVLLAPLLALFTPTGMSAVMVLLPSHQGPEIAEPASQVARVVIGLEGRAALHGVEVYGQTLSTRQIAHLMDVRSLFQTLLALFAGGVAAMATMVALPHISRHATRSGLRLGAWGALGLVVGTVGVSVLAFQALFRVLHDVLFPAGSFSFGRADAIIILFPPAFWQMAAVTWLVLAAGLAGLVLVLTRKPSAQRP